MSRLKVEVSNMTALPINEDGVRVLAEAVMDEEEIQGSATIVFVTVEEMGRLNAEYRGTEGATDVLSFSYQSEDDEDGWCEPEEAGEDDYLGDVVIAPEVARENALADGVAPSTELATLVVHGLLHLAGYDHEKDEGEMLERQKRVLSRLWENQERELI